MPDKAPVCPWCDTPKDGVSINGIRILENCGNQYGTKQKANFCPLCGRPLTEESAMKRFEPMQKPLTVDELKRERDALLKIIDESMCDDEKCKICTHYQPNNADADCALMHYLDDGDTLDGECKFEWRGPCAGEGGNVCQGS